jgi:CrcB protein
MSMVDMPPQAGAGRAPLWAALAAASVGGVIGALARYGIGLAAPYRGAGFPWATFAVNVSGCFLIGVLMVLVTEVWPGQRLLRPFVGTGVLGGYTTFSTYIVDIQHLLGSGVSTGTDVGTARIALVYLVATLAGALLAVQVGITGARLALPRPAGRGHGGSGPAGPGPALPGTTGADPA